jgi:hypothetical protein
MLQRLAQAGILDMFRQRATSLLLPLTEGRVIKVMQKYTSNNNTKEVYIQI